MAQQELKTKLLNTNYFIDNEYLDKYCKLIIDNLETKKEKYKTQSHHILPMCYFKSVKLEIDNSKENKVNLLYINHILAHYYLCLCTEGNFKYRLANGFFHLTSRKWKYEEFNPELDLSEYQKLHEEWRKSMAQEESRKIRCKQLFTGVKFPPEVIAKRKHPVLDSTKKLISENNPNRIIVQNLETGEVFKSASEVCRHYNSPLSDTVMKSVKASLVRDNRKAFGYHWISLKENNNNPYSSEERAFILNEIKNKIQITNNSIICIETQQIFKNIASANKWLKNGNIYDCLTKQYYFSGGYHWAYLSDLKTQEKLKEFIGKPRYNKDSKCFGIKVQCLETGEVFISLKEVQSKLGIKISTVLDNEVKFANGFNFIKVKDTPYSKEELMALMPNKKSKPHPKRKIINIELQKIFYSIEEAKKWLGKGDIAACLIKHQKTAGGYHWAYLEDIKTQEELKQYIIIQVDTKN